MRFTYRMAFMFPLLAGLIVAVGCDQKSASTPPAKGGAETDGGTKVAKKEDDHSGWWCDEHGLPESVCDLCSKKYREAEKAKGNWCEHNRVKTSCFKCNPGLQAKYAAEYKAKFGKEPPATEDEEKKDDGKAKK